MFQSKKLNVHHNIEAQVRPVSSNVCSTVFVVGLLKLSNAGKKITQNFTIDQAIAPMVKSSCNFGTTTHYIA
jgi:hypothetical protein